MKHSQADFKLRAVIWPALPALLLPCVLPLAQAQTRAEKQTVAHTQFKRAEQQRTALQGKPQKERSLEEYARLVKAYRRVYLITPHAAEVLRALVAVAELYQEMGRQFDPSYFQSAIDSYQFLLHEYPANSYREDALFTIGQIQHEDLNQPDTAELTFQEFLSRFPHSPKAEQAREALQEISDEREQAAKASSRKQLAEQRELQRKLPQVTRIRHWNAENYTRIVIDVEEAVKYQSARIANPDRIYFDIYTAKLSSPLAGKTLEVEGGFLRAIRVAQNQTGVVRVVLDVDKVKDYSTFLLSDPYRLVVDVRGEPVSVAKAGATPPAPKPAIAEASAPKETPATKPEKAEAASTEPVATKTRSAVRDASVALAPAPLPKPTHNGQHSLTRALGLKISRIVIDPGHGGHDTGTIGPSGLMEKDLCLDIARRLGRIIQGRLPGTEVIYTRGDDTFVPLEDRTAIANQAKADMFISIHANSSRDPQARGVETYYLNFAASEDAMEVAARENSLSQSSIHELQDLIQKIARNEKVEESRELAGEIQQSLVKRLQRVSQAYRNRGVKKAPFVVLIGANMPSVLSEISFLSNPSDERLLKKPAHRQRVAEGLFRGLESYLESINSLSYNRPKSIAADR